MTEPDRVGAPESTHPMKASLDPLSRLHIRSFVTCVLILLAFNLSLLLVASFQPRPILSRMKLIFGVMAWVTTILAARQKQRPLGPSLNLWDEAAAFLALALACSVSLDVIG